MSEFAGDSTFEWTAVNVGVREFRLGSRQDLDGDLAFEYGIFGKVDGTLRALPELAKDFQSTEQIFRATGHTGSQMICFDRARIDARGRNYSSDKNIDG